jgi:hypothetical protein
VRTRLTARRGTRCTGSRSSGHRRRCWARPLPSGHRVERPHDLPCSRLGGAVRNPRFARGCPGAELTPTRPWTASWVRVGMLPGCTAAVRAERVGCSAGMGSPICQWRAGSGCVKAGGLFEGRGKDGRESRTELTSCNNRIILDEWVGSGEGVARPSFRCLAEGDAGGGLGSAPFRCDNLGRAAGRRIHGVRQVMDPFPGPLALGHLLQSLAKPSRGGLTLPESDGKAAAAALTNSRWRPNDQCARHARGTPFLGLGLQVGCWPSDFW